MTDPVDHAQTALEALPGDPEELTAHHLDVLRAAVEGSARHIDEVRSRQITLARAVLQGDAPPDAADEYLALSAMQVRLAQADQMLAPYLNAAALIEQNDSRGEA